MISPFLHIFSTLKDRCAKLQLQPKSEHTCADNTVGSQAFIKILAENETAKAERQDIQNKHACNYQQGAENQVHKDED